MTTPESKSPLVETMVEVIFMPRSQYDITLPGIFYNSLEGRYPKKTDRSIGQIRTAAEIDGSNILDGNLTVFQSEDEERYIQLGKDLIILNIQDYGNWETFSNEVMEILTKYQNVCACELQIREINIGRLNRFDFKSIQDLVSKFEEILPTVRGTNYEEITRMRTQVEFSKGENVMTQGFRMLTHSGENPYSLMLELSFGNSKPLTITFEKIKDWLDAAHVELKQLFKVISNDQKT